MIVGRGSLELNEATVIEAMQEWLERRVNQDDYPVPKVSAVTQAGGDGIPAKEMGKSFVVTLDVPLRPEVSG